MNKLNLSLILLFSGILLPLPFEVNTANAHGWNSEKKAIKKQMVLRLFKKMVNGITDLVFLGWPKSIPTMQRVK